MELKAKVINDLGEKGGVSKAGNEWKKHEWVVETVNTQYPRKVKIQAFGDRASNLHIELGKTYNFGIDVESREYNGNWYTDVSVFSAAEDAPGPGPETGGFTQPATDFPPFSGEQAPTYNAGPATSATDDLPF